MTFIKQNPGIAELFWSFLRIGATAFGGPAIVPHMRAMVVDRKGWVDEQTFDSGTAMAQVLPGAISVQTAAYVGLRLRGLAGALAAWAGYILPAFLFMLGLSAAYSSWHAAAGQSAFRGLRAVVIAILAHAAVRAWRDYIRDKTGAALSLFAAIPFILGSNPVPVILGAGIAGRFLLKATSISHAGAVSPATAVRAREILLLLAAVAAGFGIFFLLDGKIFSLTLLMAKIDLFAFGGGYTSVPLMFHEVVTVRGWLDGTTLLDGIALGQLTPGPIVITATFVGYLFRGIGGAAAATVSIFLPSFLLVVLLSPWIERLRKKKGFQEFISGILCSFVGLLASTVVHFSQNIDWSPGLGLISAGAFAALCFRVPVLLVLTGGISIAVLFL